MDDQKPPKLLVVDDETLCIDLYRRILERAELPSDFIESGADAIDAVKKGNYSVVTTNQKNGGMKGTDLVREIKNYDPDIKVILVTGDCSLGQDDYEYVDGVIRKPFTISVYVNAIRKALELPPL